MTFGKIGHLSLEHRKSIFDIYEKQSCWKPGEVPATLMGAGKDTHCVVNK